MLVEWKVERKAQQMGLMKEIWKAALKVDC